jgi:CheY-like chemotaxis protein
LRNLELFRSLLASEKLAVLGRVVAGVAHEVNNPLAFVLANLRSLEHQAEGALVEAVVEAREGAERVARIIGDLSSLSRGGTQVATTKVDVVGLAREAARVASTRHCRGNITIEAPDRTFTVGDSDRLIQVLINLMGNGLEAAASRASPLVSVKIHLDERQVVIDVGDNGTGIPRSVRQRLFDAFFTTKGDGGTGLGLFISRSLALAHGGDLALLSTGPEGTTFRLTLPVSESLEEQGLPGLLPAIADERGHPSILVIDDESALVRALRRWLGRWAVVTGTTDPAEGLRLAETGEFSLILCDIDMPSLSGVQLIETLRLRNAEVAARVVLMTGSSSVEVEGVRVLRKPLDEARLVELILSPLLGGAPEAASGEV